MNWKIDFFEMFEKNFGHFVEVLIDYINQTHFLGEFYLLYLLFLCFFYPDRERSLLLLYLWSLCFLSRSLECFLLLL